MSRIAIVRLLVLFAAMSFAIAGLTLRLVARESKIEELTPLAQRYRSICLGVRSQLAQDRRLLDNLHAREKMLSSFAGACGDDSFVMLERCLPQPFPMEAWERCASDHDDGCLARILESAERSILTEETP